MPDFRRILAPSVLCAAVMLSACGGDGTSPTAPSGPPASDDISPIVGTWLADSITVNPKANPSVFREIVGEDGVEFTLIVQVSRAYRAVLRAFGSESEETGTIRLQGSQIFFTVQTPVAGSASGQWSRQGDRLILESDLLLDFNQDGVVDDLSTRFVLAQNQPSS